MRLKYLKINSKPINLKTKSFTTLTLFNFENNWYWPFKEMAFAKRNFSKIKGSHTAMKSGTIAGEHVYELLTDFNLANSSIFFSMPSKSFSKIISPPKSTS